MLFNATSLLLFISALSLTIFLFQVLDGLHAQHPVLLNGLFGLGLFLSVPAYCAPTIVAIRLSGWLKRIFVWADIGKKIAEERGYYN